jgi:hypothetical protein
MFSKGSECVYVGYSRKSASRVHNDASEAISDWTHTNGARRPPFSVVGRGEAFREMIVIKQHSSIVAYSS